MRPLSALALFAGLLWAQVTLMLAVAAWGYPFIAAFIAVFSLACAVFFVTSAYSVLFGAPYVPTGGERVGEMLALAGVKPGETFVDLGSGDGRLVIAAAKAGARAEGWEVNPYLWLWSRLMIRRAGLGDRATVHLGSYWDDSVAHADVVSLFLITQQMEKMQEKLRRELRPGSRVVSYVFSFPEWRHESRSDAGVYLYRR